MKNGIPSFLICAVATFTTWPLFASPGEHPVNDSAPSVRFHYKGSSVAVVNRGARGVVALCGTFDYVTAKGNWHTVGWSQNFAGPLIVDRALRAGQSYDLPQIPVKGSADRFLERRNLIVQGIVYDNGSTWGSEGAYCAMKIRDGARTARSQVVSIARIAAQDPDRFEEMIKSNNVLLYNEIVTQSVHEELQGLLLDASGELRSDYKSVLYNLVNRLGKF